MPQSADRRKARGQSTRSRLLAAATSEFAQHGYDFTTTRKIARVARANLQSIRYHFGGKQGLYLAATRAVVDQQAKALHPVLWRSRELEPGRDGTRRALCEIMETFVRQLLDADTRHAGGLIVAREMLEPRGGFANIFDTYVRAMQTEMTTLIARATGRLTRAPDAMVDAHALFGAALGFVAASHALRLRSYRPRYTTERADEIARRIVQLSMHVTAYKAPPWEPTVRPSSPLLSPRNRPRGPRKARA